MFLCAVNDSLTFAGSHARIVMLNHVVLEYVIVHCPLVIQTESINACECQPVWDERCRGFVLCLPKYHCALVIEI